MQRYYLLVIILAHFWMALHFSVCVPVSLYMSYIRSINIRIFQLLLSKSQTYYLVQVHITDIHLLTTVFLEIVFSLIYWSTVMHEQTNGFGQVSCFFRLGTVSSDVSPLESWPKHLEILFPLYLVSFSLKISIF